MKRKIHKRAMLVLATSLCLLGGPVAAPNVLQADLSRLLKAMPEARVNPESRQAMRQALVLVAQDRLDEGSQQLNAALKLDPANSYLQFFNAFAYHQLAQRGDTQKFALRDDTAHIVMSLLEFMQRLAALVAG